MRVALLACLALVCLAIAAFAQDSAAVDTTAAVVADKTGIFGAVIDKAWPLIGAFLASLSLMVASKINEATRNAGEFVKWALLYGFSLGWNLFAGWAGLAAVDPLTATWEATALVPALQMGVAAVIYKFGGHKVPALEPAASMRTASSRRARG